MRDLALYRSVIDDLVRSCREGQGQIGALRARDGVWHRYVTPEEAARSPELAEQLAINELLARLPVADREILAQMLEQEFEGGVHEALVVLYAHEATPFDDGYEGDPYHDFVGRLAGDWDWPE